MEGISEYFIKEKAGEFIKFILKKGWMLAADGGVIGWHEGKLVKLCFDSAWEIFLNDGRSS